MFKKKSGPVSIFGDTRPDLHNKSTIHDPDDPKPNDVIPQPDSLVVEKVGKKAYAFLVDKVVDDRTHLIPLSQPDDSDDISIVDYGNNRFYCFFDDNIRPTKLKIDTLLRFPSDNKTYRLYRKIPGSEQIQIISNYYDNDGNHKGNLIPLKELTGTNYSYCTDCQTNIQLIQDEPLYMELFDSSGIQSGQAVIFAKRAVIHNSYDNSPIITDLLLEGDQVLEDGFYLYSKQDKEALNLRPILVYNTGQKVHLEVDNQKCFIFGWSDVIASSPGLKHTITCKYFLRPDQQSESAIDNGHSRFEIVEKDVVILTKNDVLGNKLSIIPIWDQITQSYIFKYWLYSKDKSAAIDVTQNITVMEDFKYNEFNKEQKLLIKVELQNYLNTQTEVEHVQTSYIKLNHPNTGKQRYTIKPTKDSSLVFGVDSSVSRRPVLHYDATKKIYFIPQNIFNNKEAVIESFYRKADPMFDPNVEVEAKQPTHFLLRDITTGVSIIATPIDIEQYTQKIPVTIPNPDKYLDTNLVVEFLLFEQNEYKTLYGVPVETYLSPNGYIE